MLVLPCERDPRFFHTFARQYPRGCSSYFTSRWALLSKRMHSALGLVAILRLMISSRGDLGGWNEHVVPPSASSGPSRRHGMNFGTDHEGLGPQRTRSLLTRFIVATLYDMSLVSEHRTGCGTKQGTNASLPNRPLRLDARKVPK